MRFTVTCMRYNIWHSLSVEIHHSPSRVSPIHRRSASSSRVHLDETCRCISKWVVPRPEVLRSVTNVLRRPTLTASHFATLHRACIRDAINICSNLNGVLRTPLDSTSAPTRKVFRLVLKRSLGIRLANGERSEFPICCCLIKIRCDTISISVLLENVLAARRSSSFQKYSLANCAWKIARIDRGDQEICVKASETKLQWAILIYIHTLLEQSRDHDEQIIQSSNFVASAKYKINYLRHCI